MVEQPTQGRVLIWLEADHVLLEDEDGDGDVAAFAISRDPREAMPGERPVLETKVGDSVYATPVISDRALCVLTRRELLAIGEP